MIGTRSKTFSQPGYGLHGLAISGDDRWMVRNAKANNKETIQIEKGAMFVKKSLHPFLKNYAINVQNE